MGNSGNKLNKCGHCLTYFSNKTNLQRHILINCPKGPQIEKFHPKFFCKICDKKVQNLKEHKETVHEGIKSFKCDICKGKFSTKQSLEKHILGIHEGKKSFLCSICGYTAFLDTNLKQHIQ